MLHVALPAPGLDTIVECGIVVRQAAGVATTNFPAMPRAMLTLAAADHDRPQVLFHALSTAPVTHVHVGPFEALGLVLLPATAARLMGPSTGARVDVALPWVELAGTAEAARVDDELHRAGSDAARLRALQDSLCRVLGRGPERVRQAQAAALQQLCDAVGRHGARAAAPLGLGERQLERRCRALLGLAPKSLQRLTRFHAVLAHALRRRRLPDAEAALAAGYYDQSHLARETRHLAGAPLRELLAGARADGPWWPLATQRLARR